TLYVTHDQTEAMTLGDRVVVLRGGHVQQIGSPQHLYDNPANLFVAGFIGSPAMNFFPGQIAEGSVRSPLGTVPLPDRLKDAVQAGSGQRDVIVGIRPEHFEDASLMDDASRERGGLVTVKVDVLESMGSDAYAHFTVEQSEAIESAELAELAADSGRTDTGSDTGFTARLSAATTARAGEPIELWFDTDKLQLFDPSSGKNLVSVEQEQAKRAVAPRVRRPVCCVRGSVTPERPAVVSRTPGRSPTVLASHEPSPPPAAAAPPAGVRPPHHQRAPAAAQPAGVRPPHQKQRDPAIAQQRKSAARRRRRRPMGFAPRSRAPLRSPGPAAAAGRGVAPEPAVATAFQRTSVAAEKPGSPRATAATPSRARAYRKSPPAAVSLSTAVARPGHERRTLAG